MGSLGGAEPIYDPERQGPDANKGHCPDARIQIDWCEGVNPLMLSLTEPYILDRITKVERLEI